MRYYTYKYDCGSSSGKSISSDRVNGSKDGGVSKVNVNANDNNDNNNKMVTRHSNITLDRCASKLRRLEKKEEQNGEEEVLGSNKLKYRLQTLFSGQAADWRLDKQYKGMRKVISL